MEDEELRELILGYYGGPQTCYRHCSHPTTIEFASRVQGTVACQVCPSGYVSTAMLYGPTVDPTAFSEMVAGALEGKVPVNRSDVRVATRYTWDTGIGGESGRVLQVAFWTQNYRSSRSEDPGRTALFLCSRCRAFYLQPLSGRRLQCGRCSSA